MEKLYFKNPVFKEGINVSVRRGIKWDVSERDNVLIIDANDPITQDGKDKVLYVVDIETKVMRFADLTDSELANQHDPRCTLWEGLLPVMREVYPGFGVNEIITIVSFKI